MRLVFLSNRDLGDTILQLHRHATNAQDLQDRWIRNIRWFAPLSLKGVDAHDASVVETGDVDTIEWVMTLLRRFDEQRDIVALLVIQSEEVEDLV